MKKRIIALLVCFVTATSYAPIIGAYDYDNYISPITDSYSLYLSSIQSNIPSLSISGTQATITVRYKISANCTAKVSTALQKSANRSSWNKIQGWSDTDSGTGTHTHIHDTNISRGYYYRLACTVSTYDSSGNLIEKNTAYSNSVYCPAN